jgi:hypothetical protein
VPDNFVGYFSGHLVDKGIVTEPLATARMKAAGDRQGPP